MTLQPARPGSGRSPRIRFPGEISLERKLPLLMSAVLVVILACSLLLTYGALARSAETAARSHLSHAGRQVAGTIEPALSQRLALLAGAAGGSAVQEALTRVADAASDHAGAPEGVAPSRLPAPAREALARARAALAGLVAPLDSGLVIELWNARGERLLAFSKGDSDVAVAPVRDGQIPRLGVAGAAAEGTMTEARVSPMYADGREVRFWAVAPVDVSGRRVGYIAQQRRVSGPRDAPQSLQGLIGHDVVLYVRNRSGDMWASAPGLPAEPPLSSETRVSGLMHRRPGIGRVIASEAAVPRAPWVVVLESPLRTVLAPGRSAILSLTLVGLALTIVGTMLSWIVSRRITQPLVSLTQAAEAIARGEHAAPVLAAGDDEIARLARSFTQMAGEIATSRRELERRVTDTQAAAQALEQANQRLQEAMHDAERSRAEAEQASRAKSDFLAVMSHELRTPLNAIGGYAQLLEMELYGSVTDAQRDTLARIARSQTHLLRLINDVLNFAKLDAGQMEYALAPVLLDEALAALEPLVAPQLHAKGITLAYVPCDAELTVHADREKLQQIVLNLLANAIKFTEAGGRLTIACDDDAEAVRVHVEDTGVGIPPDRLQSIFDPFVQGDRSLNRPHEGVGLGLAISRDLARGMGAELVARSELGRGSVFTLVLPRHGPGVRDPGPHAEHHPQRA